MNAPSYIGKDKDGGIVPLHPDFVTQGFAILAQRRKGKSNLAGVIEEIMYTQQDPFVVLDPAGAHWGIRYKDDNGRPGGPSGMDVLIVGGEHGDIPLDVRPGAGTRLADTVLATNYSVIIDLSQVRMRDRRQFIVDFAEEIYAKNSTPRHLILEEADEFIPQNPDTKDEQAMRSILVRLIKGGGGKGIGFTIVSQRPAMIAKTALFQVENLIVLGMIGPADIDVIKQWFKHNVPKDTSLDAILGALPKMQPGEAWFLSPAWLHEMISLTVRRRVTYHAGQTPKRGEGPVIARPYELGEVAGMFREKLGELEDQQQQRVQTEAQLRRTLAEQTAEIAALKRENLRLSSRPAAVATVDKKEIVRPWQELTDELLAMVNDQLGLLKEDRRRASEVLEEIDNAVQEAERDIVGKLETMKMLRDRAAAPLALPPARGERAALPLASPERFEGVEATLAPRPREPRSAASGNGDLSPRARDMLSTLAGWPSGLSRGQIGAYLGVKARGGAFNSNLRQLRDAGLIEIEGHHVILTPEGKRQAGSDHTVPTSTQEVLDLWKDRLSSTAWNMLLVILSEGLRRAVTREELGHRLDIVPRGGAFNSNIRSLLSAGLIERCDQGYVPHPRNLLMRQAA